MVFELSGTGLFGNTHFQKAWAVLGLRYKVLNIHFDYLLGFRVLGRAT
jgi:hypothetical protein